MRTVRSLLLCLCLPSAWACNSRCQYAECVAIDAPAAPGDYTVDLDTSTAFVFFELGNEDGIDLALRSGSVVLHPKDAACVASAGHPCQSTLRQVRLDLGDMTVPTTDGDESVQDLRVSLEGPLDLVDTGFGLLVDPGTTAQTCATIDGQPRAELASLDEPLSMNVDFARESLSFEGTLPVRLRLGDSCQLFGARATVIASADAWSRASPDRAALGDRP